MIHLTNKPPFKGYDIPIGEVFEYNNHYYKMEEIIGELSCMNCQFDNKETGCAQVWCSNLKRKDNKNVIVSKSSITKIDRMR